MLVREVPPSHDREKMVLMVMMAGGDLRVCLAEMVLLETEDLTELLYASLLVIQFF